MTKKISTKSFYRFETEESNSSQMSCQITASSNKEVNLHTVMKGFEDMVLSHFGKPTLLPTLLYRPTCGPSRTLPGRAMSEMDTKNLRGLGDGTLLWMNSCRTGDATAASVVPVNALLMWKHNCFLSHVVNYVILLLIVTLPYYNTYHLLLCELFACCTRNTGTIIEYILNLPPVDIIDVSYCKPNVGNV